MVFISSEKVLKDNIQKNIVFYRKKNKMTQKDLGAVLGISAAAVSSWECGNNSPDIDTLFAICNSLGVGLYDMCGMNTESKVLDSDECILLNSFKLLNFEGKKKLLERADELCDLGFVKGDCEKMA